jgi:hypothetical protein
MRQLRAIQNGHKAHRTQGTQEPSEDMAQSKELYLDFHSSKAPTYNHCVT